MDDSERLRAFAVSLGDVARLWRGQIDRRLRPCGLSFMQWLTLSQLSRAGRDVGQKDLAALVSIDQFCRGLGMREHPLPAPLPGETRRYRPASAGPDEAWVPMVPADNAGTPEADLWPAGRTGNVIRAMSLVPDEVWTLNDLSAVHYLPNVQVRDPSASQGALSRPQMELIAGRVSVLNDCFY